MRPISGCSRVVIRLFELNLERFCEGCTEIEPEAVRSVLYSGEDPVEVRVLISCKNLSLCKRLRTKVKELDHGA